MKTLITTLFLFFATCTFAQKKADDVAKFNMENFVFGKVTQNKPATAVFVVTNTSEEPLLIEQASPSCGCTVSDYTRSPIAPGKTGTIKATFNAAAAGPIDKTITVKFAGIDDVKFLKLKGSVVPATSATAAVSKKK